MRHHTQDVSLSVDNAGDIVYRSVRVRFECNISFLITVSEDYLAVMFKLIKLIGWEVEVTFVVGYRDVDDLTLCV